MFIVGHSMLASSPRNIRIDICPMYLAPGMVTAIMMGMHWRICLIQFGYLLWIVLRGIDIVNYVPGLNPNFYPLSMLEQQIIQLDLSYCWAFGVKWSPSGNTLAYVGEKFLFLISWRFWVTSVFYLKRSKLTSIAN